MHIADIKQWGCVDHSRPDLAVYFPQVTHYYFPLLVVLTSSKDKIKALAEQFTQNHFRILRRMNFTDFHMAYHAQLTILQHYNKEQSLRVEVDLTPKRKVLCFYCFSPSFKALKCDNPRAGEHTDSTTNSPNQDVVGQNFLSYPSPSISTALRCSQRSSSTLLWTSPALES